MYKNSYERMFKSVQSVGFALLLLFSMPVSAALTPINSPNGADPNLVQNSSQTSIMNHLYGSGNYTRVDDSLDQVWTANNGTTQVVARFAGNNETLGYFVGNSGATGAGNFQTLYNVNGSGYGVTGGSTINQNSLRWGLKTSGQQGDQYFSSLASNNTLDVSASRDHMVTFKITGTSGGFNDNVLGNYVIAFEDLIDNTAQGRSSDRDFNDAVFEVGQQVKVPEPATYALLGSSLLMAFAVRRKAQKATA
ncbi:MAG: DUF4114 domain-containing protein [Chlamydiales bacterium]|nr:DUF4114 domain-containing protein [Chlamydiales bacterium]